MRSKVIYFFSGIVFAVIAGAAAYLIITSGEEPVDPNPVQRKSPIAIAKTHVDSAYIKIVYGQPYKRGREIFGELEPYGEVWRTGANEATELTTTADLLINGEELQAGTYALFTIPRPDNWTIILNDSLGQWGAFTYDSAHDVLRTTVPAATTDQSIEAFTIQFSETEGNFTTIELMWDTTRVAVPITVLNDEF